MERLPILLASFLWLVSSQARAPLPLTVLTVPPSRLPAGCQLAAAPTLHLDGNSFKGGLWGGLPIERNPWVGTARPVLAAIRERTGPTATPDAGPLTARDLALFRSRLAEGIDEGYAAFYLQSDDQVIAVYALTPADATVTMGRAPARMVRVDLGPTTAYVSGTDGPCFRAVGSYLNSLSQ